MAIHCGSPHGVSSCCPVAVMGGLESITALFRDQNERGPAHALSRVRYCLVTVLWGFGLVNYAASATLRVDRWVRQLCCTILLWETELLLASGIDAEHHWWCRIFLGYSVTPQSV